jgi:hypothetical protein
LEAKRSEAPRVERNTGPTDPTIEESNQATRNKERRKEKEKDKGKMKKTLPYPKVVRQPSNDALYSSFLQAIAYLKMLMHVTDMLKIPIFAKFIVTLLTIKEV